MIVPKIFQNGFTYSFVVIFLNILSCKANIPIIRNDSIREEITLNNQEIRFIYHEAIRRLLYEENISVTSVENLADFYSFDKRSCGYINIEILVSDKIDNNYIFSCLHFNKIPEIKELKTLEVLKAMNFNFQPKIYFATIIDTAFTFNPPIVGYIKLSDVVVSGNGHFYISATLINRLICEDFDKVLNWVTEYTFEIEKCKSGFLRFKRIIDGMGEVSSSLGPISTIKILQDIEECK